MNKIISIFTLLSTLIFVYLPTYSQISQFEADSLLERLEDNTINGAKNKLFISNELITFYQENGNKCNEIKALIKRANAENSMAEYEKSLATNIKAQKEFESSDCDSSILALLYLSYAGLYVNLNDIEKSDSLSELGIRIYQPDWDKGTLINLYLTRGDGYRGADEVMAYHDTAYQLAIENNKPKLEQRALIGIGTVYAIDDDFKKASEYFKSAVKIAKKRNINSDLSILFNNLAGVSESNDSMIMYVDSALYFAEQANDLSSMQIFSQNRAYFYYINGEFEEGYDNLWWSMSLKDSLLNLQRIEAIADMQEKYQAEKKANEIKSLKLERLSSELDKIRYKRNQNILLWSSLVIVLMAIGLWSRLNFIRKSKAALQKEKDISEGLLLNILPYEVAEELKEKGYTDAKEFDQTTILFTDFKGFTSMSEIMSAADLVSEIDSCFKGFDHIMEKYKIEKIKTIGDAYMAAGGLHDPRTAEAKDVIMAGLEMQEFMINRRLKHDELGLPSFEMRVGIHTGTVIAGVVGIKKFQYDIWGDTVNTASRMESSGEIGKVNISQTTYEQVKNNNNFTFKSRGKIEAKGKGEMDMHFVRLC